MTARISVANTTFLKTTAGRLSAGWAARLLLGLLLFTLPAAVQAQFDYTTENGQITITGYDCSDGPAVIPSSINGLPVTTIGDSAFSGCTGLTSVTIPNSVTTIGDRAFDGCTGLNAIEVEALNPAYSSLDGVLFNKGLTTLLRCPEGKAGSYTLPNSVTTIGDYAFSGCTGLTSVPIGNSVTTIGDGAFYGCAGLTSVTIGNSVTTIGDGAFYGCTGLTSVTIPNSVTSIGDGAFDGCTGLTSVNFQGNAPVAGDVVFDGADGSTVYYLPGTIGWGATFSGRPTAIWSLSYPVILSSGPGFGATANSFGFLISWATNATVLVEASLLLPTPVWTPVSTNVLTSGTSQFTDPQWTDHPARLYRVVTQ
jgi:BspA type Leucine rich repeat region (6 copies)